MSSRPMNDREAREMMERCANELTSMRATIALLQPKAEAYDNLVTVLRLLPRPSQGAGEDLVWILKNRIKELPAQEPIT